MTEKLSRYKRIELYVTIEYPDGSEIRHTLVDTAEDAPGRQMLLGFLTFENGLEGVPQDTGDFHWNLNPVPFKKTGP